MHFCENCGNMYYIELNQNDTETLIYNCRNCGFNEGWDAPQKSQLDLFKKPIAIKEKKELDYEEL